MICTSRFSERTWAERSQHVLNAKVEATSLARIAVEDNELLIAGPQLCQVRPQHALYDTLC